jgi:hypothetical protein
VLESAVSARQQLRSALVRAGVPLRSTLAESESTIPIVDRIRRCVASGLRDRVARLAPDGASYQSARNDDAGDESWHVHPDSVFFRGRLPALVVYGEAVTSGGKTLLRLVTPVSPEEIGI